MKNINKELKSDSESSNQKGKLKNKLFSTTKIAKCVSDNKTTMPVKL